MAVAFHRAHGHRRQFGHHLRLRGALHGQQEQYGVRLAHQVLAAGNAEQQIRPECVRRFRRIQNAHGWYMSLLTIFNERFF